jgi:hypothetical protein
MLALTLTICLCTYISYVVLLSLQTVDRAGLGVSWGVPFIVAAVAMIVAGIIIGFVTIKGEQIYTLALGFVGGFCHLSGIRLCVLLWIHAGVTFTHRLLLWRSTCMLYSSHNTY